MHLYCAARQPSLCPFLSACVFLPSCLLLSSFSTPQHQVEVLFVLCALCGGKRKQAVQDQLAGLGLVRTLADMFARLNWDAPPPPAPEPHGIHGPGCACNPQSVSA